MNDEYNKVFINYLICSTKSICTKNDKCSLDTQKTDEPDELFTGHLYCSFLKCSYVTGSVKEANNIATKVYMHVAENLQHTFL